MIGTHCTTIRVEDGLTKVRYHNTDIVIIGPDKFILDTGGWYTATTKRRMNQALEHYGIPYRVYQVDSKWWVVNDKGRVTFKDHLILSR